MPISLIYIVQKLWNILRSNALSAIWVSYNPLKLTPTINLQISSWYLFSHTHICLALYVNIYIFITYINSYLNILFFRFYFTFIFSNSVFFKEIISNILLDVIVKGESNWCWRFMLSSWKNALLWTEIENLGVGFKQCGTGINLF
jgi:hypothetical protein